MGNLSHPRRKYSRNSSIRRLGRRFLLADNQLVLLFILLLSFIGYTLNLTDDLFPGGDNARYLILAKSLLVGSGYRNIAIVRAPYHTLAPPGFPLLLAPVLSVFGMNIVIAKMLVGAFGVISIAVVYALFKRNCGYRYAIGIALLYGTAPLVFMYARRVYSDLPFAVVSLLALWSADHYATKQSLFDMWILPTILALTVSFYLRPIALSLFLAVTLWLLIKKRPKQSILIFLLVVLLIIPWYVWVDRMNADVAPGHFSAFMPQSGLLELAHRVLDNILSYAQLFAENIFYVLTKGGEHLGLTHSWAYFSSAVVILVCSLIIVGFIRAVYNGLQLTDLYVGIYFAVLISYSFTLDRFIIPVLPFILYYCIQGFIILTEKIMQRNPERIVRTVTHSFLLCIVLSNAIHVATRLYQEQNFAVFAPTAASHYEIARWARHHLAANAIIATDYADFFYVYADRKTASLSEGTGNFGDEGAVQFVVTDSAQIIQVQERLRNLYSHSALLSRYCASDSEICLYEIVSDIDKDNS